VAARPPYRLAAGVQNRDVTRAAAWAGPQGPRGVVRGARSDGTGSAARQGVYGRGMPPLCGPALGDAAAGRGRQRRRGAPSTLRILRVSSRRCVPAAGGTAALRHSFLGVVSAEYICGLCICRFDLQSRYLRGRSGCGCGAAPLSAALSPQARARLERGDFNILRDLDEYRARQQMRPRMRPRPRAPRSARDTAPRPRFVQRAAAARARDQDLPRPRGADRRPPPPPRPPDRRPSRPRADASGAEGAPRPTLTPHAGGQSSRQRSKRGTRRLRRCAARSARVRRAPCPLHRCRAAARRRAASRRGGRGQTGRS
jgi:hypothetical protein